MGQQTSQPPNASILSLPISSQQEKIKFATSSSSFLQNSEDPLFNRCCTFTSKPNNNQKWKKLTISELESSKSEVWPDLLLKTLKQSNTETVDLVYQSDMYWAIKHENESPRLALKESLQSFEQSSFDCSRPDLDFNGAQENRIPLGLFDDKKEDQKKRSDSLEFFAEKNSIPNSYRNTGNRSCDGRQPKPRLTIPQMSLIRKGSQEPEPVECLSPFMRIGEGTVTPKMNGANDPYRNTGFQSYSPFMKESDSQVKGQTRLLQCLQKYKMITGIIKKHLSSDKNIFFMLINEFAKYFDYTFGDFKRKAEAKKMSSAEIDAACTRATQDIENFIHVLYEGMNRYYKLDRLRQSSFTEYKTLFRKENLTRSLMSIVFNQKIYNAISEVYSVQNQTIEDLCDKNFALLKTLEIESFGVDEKLTLNNTTLRYLREKGYIANKSVAHSNHDQTFSFEERKEEAKPERTSLEFQQASFQEEVRNSQGDIKEESFLPYQKAIEKISSIRGQPSPVYKLEILIKVVRLIQTAIKDFYVELGLRYEESLSNFQLLGIFYYVLVRSNLKDIYTQLQIIKKFVPKQNIGVAGMEYIKVIETVITFIQTKNPQRVDLLENFALDLQEFYPFSPGRVTSVRPQNNTFDNI